MNPTDSQYDVLTGLLSRKAFLEEFAKAIKVSQTNDRPTTLALLDIDDFLRVNTEYGHQCGDDVLIILANFIKNNLGISAIPARFGGDEFAILFPDTDREQAFLTLENIRKEMEKHHFLESEHQTVFKGITITGGIASYPIDGRNEAELIRKADQALYRGKNSTRNTIRLAYEERMVPKTTHFTLTQLERLSKLANEKNAGEAELLREALDDLLIKYGVNEIET